VKADNKRASIGGSAVLHVQTMLKNSIYGYRPNQQGSPFLRITTRLPSHIAAAKRLIERGLYVEGLGNFAVEVTFESNIAFVLRFMASF
jgi:hypothetical protein